MSEQLEDDESSLNKIRKLSQMARYSDIFEKMWDSAFLIDPDNFIILDANSASERALSVAPSQARGHSLLNFVNRRERDQFAKHLRIARRRYYPRQFDSNWNTRDGRALKMHVSACFLKLLDGSDAIQVIAKDVTAIREAEEKAERYLKELQHLNAKLEALSVRDEMTGLANFRHFNEEAKKEHERSERYGTTYSIIFCDVDHFKKYNDAHGHPAGDEVLRGVARVLQQLCRNTDLPARYGGEEFVVLAPGVNWEGALILAERLRAGVQNYPFPNRETQPLGTVSISVGVASFPSDANTLPEIIERADQALYQSKHGGRNRVTAAQIVKKAA
ncbi:MAG: diguanylate cyclase [Bacteriovoracia bacterium]